MDEVLLLTNIAIFTLLAGFCSTVFINIKLPPLVGYLITGIIITNVWHTSDDGDIVIGILSNMGLVLLMFCIGLEINLKRIKKQGLFAVKVVIIQLPLMLISGFISGYIILGIGALQSLCLGAIISGSSTAAVMAVLRTQSLIDRENVDMIVLVTIIEDIGQVIILSAITPMIAGLYMEFDGLLIMTINILVFMFITIIIGLKLMPRAMNWVSDNVSSEILMVLAVSSAFGMALLSTYVGLSMAIGQFLMGMMIAPSKRGREIKHQIEPIKNLFMAMFFISVGMEISISALISNLGKIILFYLIFVISKVCIVLSAYWIGHENGRNGFTSAIGLSAMGEFAFIISREALDYDIINESFYISVIGAALVSMALLPVLNRLSGFIWDTIVQKCPKCVYSTLGIMNRYRDSIYKKVYSTSKRSRRAISRRITHSYIDILVIALIPIVSFVEMPYAINWFICIFGGNSLYWDIVPIAVDFMLMFIPIFFLINNVKYIDELTIMGLKPIKNKDWKRNDLDMIHRKLLNMNTYFTTVVVDLLVLVVTPNPPKLWEHVIVMSVALVFIGLLYYKIRKGPLIKSRLNNDGQNEWSKGIV